MATKGKGKEKVKPSSSQADTRQTPTEKEVIPGRISEKAWLKLIDRAKGTEIATEVVNEIFEVSFSIVNSHYLEKQAFPHAISEAKQSLLKIIEWQFLARDGGEKDTTSNPSWVPDEEPLPAPIDSWARGMVPSNTPTALTTSIEAMAPVRVHSQPPEERSHQEQRASSRPDTGASTVEFVRAPKQKMAGSRARPVARHTKPRLVPMEKPVDPPEQDVSAIEVLETDSIRSHTPDSESSEAPSETQHPLPYGMKPVQLTWQKEVSYDKRGKIVNMLKLEPSKFPNHSVRPAVTISKVPAPQATAKKQVNKTKLKSRANELTKRGGGELRTQQRRAGESRRFPEGPALPALIDTIDPVAGVTVREAGRTIQGPVHHKLLSNTPNTKLTPLRLSVGDK